MKSPGILVINPGSTSTKLAYFAGDLEAESGRLEHPPEELARYRDIAAQLPYRLAAVRGFVEERRLRERGLDAIAARGGLMRPVASGVYRVTGAMVEDLRRSKERWGREHASSLGPMVALMLSGEYGMPAFTADPVTVDEMEDIARVSGVPEITRKSHLHALNIKAVCRKAAASLGKGGIEEANFVAAHVGGGVSVAAVRGGRIVDVNNALLGMGPFSPTRAGALPIGDLAALALSGKYDLDSLEKKLVYESGLAGYLGTSDVREVEKMIDAGDPHAALVFHAMAYQTAKEAGAMAAVLEGRVDAVVLTGGAANSARFRDVFAGMVSFIAPLITYPGEFEMEALAGYARAALSGTERVLEYG